MAGQKRQNLPAPFQLWVTPGGLHGAYQHFLPRTSREETPSLNFHQASWSEGIVTGGSQNTQLQAGLHSQDHRYERWAVHRSHTVHLPLPGPELGLPRTLPCAGRGIPICNFKCLKLPSTTRFAGMDKEIKEWGSFYSILHLIPLVPTRTLTDEALWCQRTCVPF